MLVDDEERKRILEERASLYVSRLESFFETTRSFPIYASDPKYDNISITLTPIIGFDKSVSCISNMEKFIDDLSKIYLSKSDEDEDLILEINHQLRNSKTYNKTGNSCKEEYVIPFALEFANTSYPFCQFTFDYFKKHWEEELINSCYIGRAWGYSPEQIRRDDGLIIFDALNVIGSILSEEEIESRGILDIPIENMNYVIKAIAKDGDYKKFITTKTVKLLYGLREVNDPKKAYEYSYIAGRIVEYPDFAEKLEYLSKIEWKTGGLSSNLDYISSTQEYIGMISSAKTLKNYFLITKSSKYKNEKNSVALNHIYRLIMNEDVPDDIGKFLLDSNETKNVCDYISNPDITERILNEEKIEGNSNNFIYRLARINGYKNPIDDYWKNQNFTYASMQCDYCFDISISYVNENWEKITSILMIADDIDFELMCLLGQNRYFINESNYSKKAINAILSLDSRQKKQIYDNLLEDEKRWSFERFNEIFDESIYGKSGKIKGYYDLLLLKYFQAEDKKLNLNEAINQRMKYYFERIIIQPLLDKFILSYQVFRDDKIENESEYKQLMDAKGRADIRDYMNIQRQNIKINQRIKNKYKERKKS